MDHVAIISKQFGNLISRILDGRKKIESRWSKNKIAPWDKIKPSDTVYFKNSGGPLIAKAVVSKVLQFDNLSPDKVKEILDKWGGEDGIDITNYEKTLWWAKHKKYCVLIWLKDPKKIAPFQINKEGFGSAAAWLCTEHIHKLGLGSVNSY